jgi:hypothetical protein
MIPPPSGTGSPYFCIVSIARQTSSPPWYWTPDDDA